MTSLPAPPAARAVRDRLAGIDLARALAFGGMLLAHFAVSHGDDPGWLQAADNAADGRAAPLFCVLLGVGAGLLLARGRSDAVFVRRGAALFVLGALLWPQVPQVYLILPHYGLLLALVPLLRRLPDRALLPAAAVAFAVPSVVVATSGGHGLRGPDQPATYAEVLEVVPVTWNLLWTGGYPLVGWVGFALVGLWLARLPLRERGIRWRLAVGGVTVAALQPLAARADRETGDDLASSLLESHAHSNHFAWYVFAAATAVAAIGACLLVADRAPLVLRPLQRLGSMMLSAYVLHLALGVLFIWDWAARGPSLATQVVVAACVFAAFTFAADRWSRRRSRGPLETVLRAVAP